ncbi:MAG: Ig-like domain-containing protein, partial [Bacteroidota bacterium]|nr:Ig-like domain-containing protein [Bacteroidota bacterium]
TATYENTRPKALNGVSADIVYVGDPDQVTWYHRNTLTAVSSLSKLTFGAIMKGDGLVSKSTSVLESSSPQLTHTLSIYPQTVPNSTVNNWITKLKANILRIDALNFEQTRTDHQSWWNNFWNRSWVFLRGDATATTTTQGYILQRFVTACGGRGAYPIKFNGSIFVVDNSAYKDVSGNVSSVSADYRTWGGQYWFQNTRAMYWPRLAAGDFDVMRPLFDMYYNILPANSAQIQTYYNHDGAYFAETAPFWGGLKYAGPEVTEDWTLHYFTPILEISMMMLDYYEFTGDVDFAKQRLLPVATAGITFFNKHFQRDTNGKLLLDPDNSIEMYWKVKNPAPDIAGLRAVLPRLIALPESLVDADTRLGWMNFLKEIPELPQTATVLLPYQGDQTAIARNSENPELYSVYPFRLYGIGKPNIQLAQSTFNARKCTFKGCWSQDPVQASQLGFASVAKNYVNFNLTRKDAQQKFPAFWERANDYSPDEDNGGNGEHGLQQMIMQTDGKKIYLLPAWPQGWEGDFKLNAPFQTTVEGTIANGTITNLIVTPAERTADVVILSSTKIDRTGWMASASNNNTDAAKGIDESVSSRWDTQATQTNGQTFTLQFAKKEKVNKLVLDYATSPNDGPDTYELYESNNGIDWVGPVVNGKGGNSTTEISFPTINTQYLKIKQVGTKAMYWSICDLNAFGNTQSVSVTSLQLQSTATTLPVNGILQISGIIAPSNAENQQILWSSDKPTIASVDAFGKVTGLTEGQVKIKGITLDGLFAAELTLTVSGSLESDIKQPSLSSFSFDVMPNPVQSVVAFRCNVPTNTDKVTIQLYDLKGACVKTKEINKQTNGFFEEILDVHSLPTGNYMACVTAGLYSATKHILLKY